jgi:hypothetical protein
MSDYETMNVMLQQFSLLFTIFATYATIVFAFLVVGYLVAQRLTRLTVAILIVLFTLATLQCAMTSARGVANSFAIVDHVRQAIAAGRSTLGWIPVFHTNALALRVTEYTGMGLFILTYIGALVFFVQQHRSARQIVVASS